MTIIRINGAKLLDQRNGEIVLEIPSIKLAHLDLGKKAEWVDHETDERCQLNERRLCT